MESMFAKIIAEGSITIAKSIAKKLKEVEIATPAVFQKPVIPGDYPTNPEANREGLVVLANNYSGSQATISFFQFRSFHLLS